VEGFAARSPHHAKVVGCVLACRLAARAERGHAHRNIGENKVERDILTSLTPEDALFWMPELDGFGGRGATGTRSGPQPDRGFSVTELVVVIAIVAILASVALPVVRFARRRQREIELCDRVQRIAWAIDRYAELRQRGLLKGMRAIAQEDYPKSLDELTHPLELIDGKSIRLLRERDLIDPMTGQNEWTTQSTTDAPDSASSNGANVWDVHSKSTALALDGHSHYNEW
jgi:general secretion pathway protein G